MAERTGSVTVAAHRRARRAQQMTLIHAVMVCLLSLILIQMFLLTVALEGHLGGHGEIVIPSAVASALCFAGACWLIRYVVGARRG